MNILDTVITSRQNPLVKWVASLHDAKGRRRDGAFIAEGEKLTLEAAAARLAVTHILVSERQRERLGGVLCEAFSAPCFDACTMVYLSDEAFEKISTEKTPRGVICIIKYLDFFKEIDIIYKEDFFSLKGQKVLALSSVRDPGNLGSVIRSAVAFGVRHIILSSDCADLYNPKTVRSAMGSLFKVSVSCVSDMASFVRAAREAGRRVLAAELRPNAVSIDEVQLCAEDIVMIGNEGHGIDPALSALASGSVYIPIAEQTESLNAAVAAAIFMFAQGRLS